MGNHIYSERLAQGVCVYQTLPRGNPVFFSYVKKIIINPFLVT
jgi:hypothetical protein